MKIPENIPGSWSAGEVSPCRGGSTHEVTNVHVIFRCACGAAYISTDSGIALGMAKQHARSPVPGDGEVQ